MKTDRTRLVLLAVLLIATAAVAAGCGDDESSSSSNATDAAFVTDMTTHHQGAIELAELAQTRADRPEIKAMAADVSSTQKAEIAVMHALGQDMHAMGMHYGGHMRMSDAEMGMETDMSALRNARPFDKAFIDAMIPHHLDAIAMARELLKKGKQPQLRRMAREIIKAQTAEIAQMRAWHRQWYRAP